MAFVKRDPFARTEIHKTHEPGICAWCGAIDPMNAVVAGVSHKTYRFRVESDGGRTFEDTRLFCTLACRNDYNGG